MSQEYTLIKTAEQAFNSIASLFKIFVEPVIFSPTFSTPEHSRPPENLTRICLSMNLFRSKQKDTIAHLLIE